MSAPNDSTAPGVSSPGTPPPLLTPPASTPVPAGASGRMSLTIWLSICLGLFLLDGVVSLADDSLILIFGSPLLVFIRMVISFFTAITAIATYIMIGVTPMVPKRWFVPVTLFMPVAFLAGIPFLIYNFDHAQWWNWAQSLVQVLLGFGILALIQGGFKWRWPLVPANSLGAQPFSWLNAVGFLFANLFVLLPVALVYLLFCAALGLNHFTGGFLTVEPKGLTVQMRKYARDDGKTIQLYPMAHVGDKGFYQQISQTFPTNSLILMEGVTDEEGLLTNKISYQRMAHSLGLAEQKTAFHPTHGKIVHADIDVSEFSKSTIALLNLVMRIQGQGPNAMNVQKLTEYPVTLQMEQTLFDDILNKRNQHLLGEIHTNLTKGNDLVIPWGAAHMPGIAAGIEKEGFHLVEKQNFMVVRFGSNGNMTGTGQ